MSYTPRAIAHEDAFPYGQSAVVPHKQKVEDFISDTKQKDSNSVHKWDFRHKPHSLFINSFNKVFNLPIV